MDFSSGVVSHVKSFYNPSLWETKLLKQSTDASPKSKPDIVIDDVDSQPTKPSQNTDKIAVGNPDNNNDSDKKLVTEPEKEPEIVKTLLPAAVAESESASTDNLPPGVLYKVKATYKYQAEDMDELSFEVGELIDVIEYDDPEEQEEGWLCGAKDSTGQKGLFPANFTKPI
jgi:hypothetical protein